jgi:hypothetical protein
VGENAIEINITALRGVVEHLFRHLEQTQGGTTIALQSDYYWDIPRAGRINVSEDPTVFTIGQLSADWATLSELNEENTVTYAFVWLAEVLRAIGEEIYP